MSKEIIRDTKKKINLLENVINAKYKSGVSQVGGAVNVTLTTKEIADLANAEGRVLKMKQALVEMERIHEFDEDEE